MSRFAVAEWDYTASADYEMTLAKGDIITIIETHNDDWWEGFIGDRMGFFPANRTRLLPEGFNPHSIQDPHEHSHYRSPPIPDSDPTTPVEETNPFRSGVLNSVGPNKSDQFPVDTRAQLLPVHDQLADATTNIHQPRPYQTDNDQSPLNAQLLDDSHVPQREYLHSEAQFHRGNDSYETVLPSFESDMGQPTSPLTLEPRQSSPATFTPACNETELAASDEDVHTPVLRIRNRHPHQKTVPLDTESHSPFLTDREAKQIREQQRHSIASIDTDRELTNALSSSSEMLARPRSNIDPYSFGSKQMQTLFPVPETSEGQLIDFSEMSQDFEGLNLSTAAYAVEKRRAGSGGRIDVAEEEFKEREDFLDEDEKSALESLPEGWQHAYDDDGTVYYFNETTGESTWEHPTSRSGSGEQEDLQSIILNEDNHETTVSSGSTVGLTEQEAAQLEYKNLPASWIREQSAAQVKYKVVGSTSAKTMDNWKVYWIVLASGFIVIYPYNSQHLAREKPISKKELPSHTGKHSDSKTSSPLGIFDLASCMVQPGTKAETKRKHVFLVTTTEQSQILFQMKDDKEFGRWLDTIMRDMVKRKEGQGSSDAIELLTKGSKSTDFKFHRTPRKGGHKHEGDSGKSQNKFKKTTTGSLTQTPGDAGSGSLLDEDSRSKKKYGGWFGAKGSKEKDRKRGKSSERQPIEVEPLDLDAVFGGYLTVPPDDDIPAIVRACIQEVDKRGLTSVGIYRLSGPASTIQRLRSAYNHHDPDIDLSKENDINVVTGLLKLYFRELKQPLLTYELYEEFIKASKIDDYDERMYTLKHLIECLPQAHYDTSAHLFSHLARVAYHSEENKMEASNLALIFSVGVLRSGHEDLSSMLNTGAHSKVVEAIIQHAGWFFDSGDESEGAQPEGEKVATLDDFGEEDSNPLATDINHEETLFNAAEHARKHDDKSNSPSHEIPEHFENGMEEENVDLKSIQNLSSVDVQ
ncbi:hypothetical protein BZG36_02644 [Bifiguratus adelaidae]|uniref:Rho GTPase-activating protein 27 n=1 Tax=Bifiguratus adelaidae TaxID=1938954 RepID=A0A261Y2V2_9FUNG|nr:hypothetical protein BZG36_02644 [Bifiguratus adelaidae]